MATLKARYNLLGVDAFLPGPDAEAMFVQVRDFALAMKPLMERTCGDIGILGKLASWLPSCWTGAFLVPQEKADELVRKWTDVPAREEELHAWLHGATLLIARAEQMLGVDGVQRAGKW